MSTQDFDGTLVPVTTTWEDVPQLAITAPLLAGESGPLNAQAQVLLNRTEILKAAVESANSLGRSTMLLSQDALIIPLSSQSFPISLSATTVSISVINENVDETSSWAFNINEVTGLTYSITGAVITIDTITAASGGLTITATRVGFPNLYRRLSLSTLAFTSTPQMVLSSDSVTTSANLAGVVDSYANVYTDVTIYNGIQDDTANWTLTKTDSNTTSTKSGNRISVSNISSDTGYVTITATRPNYPSITKKFSVTKAKTGSPKTFSLVTSSNIFSIDKTGTVANPSISVSTNSLNLAGSPTFQITSGTGTLVVNGNTATLAYSSMSTDTVVITATQDGFTDTTTIAKIRAGIDGSAGLNSKSLELKVTSQVFRVSQTGSGSPASVDFSINAQNLAGSPTFTVLTGSATLTGTGSARSLSYANLVSDNATIQVSQDGLIDYITISKIKDGINSSLMILSNESVNVPAAVDGTVLSYSGASSYVTVYNGSTDDTANWTLTKTDTNTTSTLVGTLLTATALAADSGYVDVTATRSGFASITRRFSITKSKTGATGSTGTNAKSLSLSSTSQVFQITKLGANSPTSITFTSNPSNLTGSPVFSCVGGTLSGTGNVRTMTFAQMTDANIATITVTQDGLTDSISVVKIREGSDGVAGANAIVGLLTNESQVLSADSTGVVSSFASATGTFKVYNGTSDVTGSGTTYSIVSQNNCTGTINSTTGVYSVSAMSADVATLVMRVVYSGTTIDKILSLAKAKAGPQGTTGNTGNTGSSGVNSISGVLTNESFALPCDSAGNVSSYLGAVSTFKIYNGITDDTANWTLTKTESNLSGTLVSGTYTVTSIAADAGYVDISATRASYSTITKRFSVTKQKAGAQGLAGTNGTNGTNGVQGPRGPGIFSKTITGSTWSDAEAVAAVVAAGFTAPILQDRVTLVNNSVQFVATKYYDGAAWQTAAVQIDGNLLVAGSVVADRIDTRQLTIRDASNNVIFSAGTPLQTQYISQNAIFANRINVSKQWINYVWLNGYSYVTGTTFSDSTNMSDCKVSPREVSSMNPWIVHDLIFETKKEKDLFSRGDYYNATGLISQQDSTTSTSSNLDTAFKIAQYTLSNNGRGIYTTGVFEAVATTASTSSSAKLASMNAGLGLFVKVISPTGVVRNDQFLPNYIASQQYALKGVFTSWSISSALTDVDYTASGTTSIYKYLQFSKTIVPVSLYFPFDISNNGYMIQQKINNDDLDLIAYPGDTIEFYVFTGYGFNLANPTPSAGYTSVANYTGNQVLSTHQPYVKSKVKLNIEEWAR